MPNTTVPAAATGLPASQPLPNNVVVLRSTFSNESALARIDRELAVARQNRSDAIRLREQAHRIACKLEATILRLEADRDIALMRAGGAVCISHEEVAL